ncbi:MAG: SDR family oxidoreductase [Halieaceae bacterium]|jgi:NAD(P)-dependent dehydrogenase (short-subunit alcohol dehydrogenase family)|nr:SDR family oxidoreductase [Halieaceae bacterium]
MSRSVDVSGILSGQVALVTGGAKGIGAGISQRLLEAGAAVVVCGRSTPEQLPASGAQQAEFIACDVRDTDDIEKLMQQIMETHGRLDILVNNAGGSPAADAATASPRFSEAIIRLNLIAPLNVAQAANRIMQQQDEGGSIINIASVSTIRPSPGTAAYGAAKAGLVNLGTSLAVEWAPRVRVNSIICGLTRTEQSHLHYGDEEGIAAVASTIPLGRMGEPGDIGDACVFLASPMASYISGASLAVHGGGERPAFLSAANAPQP